MLFRSDPTYDQRASLNLFHFLTSSDLVYCSFLEFILVHARSINGDIVRSHRCLSSEKELLPSFGVNTNRLLDALGYLPATIYRIHSTYLLARQINNANEAEKTFLREMGVHKLPLLEAALVWRSIMTNQPVKELYREREALGTV